VTQKPRINTDDLFKHLEELRTRLFISFIVVVVATLICFAFVDYLRVIMLRPAGDLRLIYVTPPEALMASIRIAFVTALALTMPFILTQLMLFVAPALYKDERRMLAPIVLAMVFFFALGVSFAYFVVLPFAIRFFLNFATDDLAAMFTISNYLSFVTSFIFSFGLVFQLPLVFLFLGKLNLINARFLRQNRKFAILIIAIASAVITPPDVFSQIMMGIPLLGLLF
jgi:sec-independent protein translocase protein TatC